MTSFMVALQDLRNLMELVFGPLRGGDPVMLGKLSTTAASTAAATAAAAAAAAAAVAAPAAPPAPAVTREGDGNTTSRKSKGDAADKKAPAKKARGG